MTQHDREKVFEAARSVAGKVPLRLAFDDSLEGDLKRLEVSRRMKAALPKAPAHYRHQLIRDLLTP